MTELPPQEREQRRQREQAFFDEQLQRVFALLNNCLITEEQAHRAIADVQEARRVSLAEYELDDRLEATELVREKFRVTYDEARQLVIEYHTRRVFGWGEFLRALEQNEVELHRSRLHWHRYEMSWNRGMMGGGRQVGRSQHYRRLQELIRQEAIVIPPPVQDHTEPIYLLPGSASQTGQWLTRFNVVHSLVRCISNPTHLRGARVNQLIRVGTWQYNPLAFSPTLEMAFPDWRHTPIFDCQRNDYLTEEEVEWQTEQVEEYWRDSRGQNHQRWVLHHRRMVAMVFGGDRFVEIPVLHVTETSISTQLRRDRVSLNPLLIDQLRIHGTVTEISESFSRGDIGRIHLSINLRPREIMHEIGSNGDQITIWKVGQLDGAAASYNPEQPLTHGYSDRITILEQKSGINLTPCRGCKNLHGEIYGGNFFCCGLHPYGPEEVKCSDRTV